MSPLPPPAPVGAGTAPAPIGTGTAPAPIGAGTAPAPIGTGTASVGPASPRTAVHPVHVRGGTHGIAAESAAIDQLATEFARTAVQALRAAADLHGYLVHPALAGSAAFDPMGWAHFESELLDALDGPGGVTWIGTQTGALEIELHLAATGYREVDRLDTALHDALAGLGGYPAALGAALHGGGSALERAQRAITTDPELADSLVNDLGIPPLLIKLGVSLPDGRGVADRLGVDRSLAAAQPPRALSDIVGELGHRSDDSHHGAIDVRILTLPDGSRRVIVDITGTKSWSLRPTGDVTSVVTNARALVGKRTAYEQGVLDAMRDAGVRKSDDVMLVGHSQGGMVAVNTAADASHSGEFHVTHVVTAGSPIGLIAGRVPHRVKVLALENTADLVPHLDGRTNPDRSNVTTASGRYGNRTVGGDHDIEQDYVPLARDTTASGNASVRDFLTGARDYLRGDSVETHTYQVRREYP